VDETDERAADTTGQSLEDGSPGLRRVQLAAWVLAVAALVAAVTATAAVLLVLSGAVDREFFSTYSSDGDGNQTSYVDPSVDLAYRWMSLPYIVPADGKLLAPVLVVAVLAGLHLAGHRVVDRGRSLVPRAARWTAVAAAGLSTVLVVATVGVAAVLQRTGATDGEFQNPAPPLLDLAAPLALSGVHLVLAVVTAVLLVGPPLAQTPHDDSDLDDTDPDDTDPDDTDPDEEWTPGDGPPAEGHAPANPVPLDAPAVAPTAPAEVPRLAEADRVLYERPAP
jgi:hypothetical protein